MSFHGHLLLVIVVFCQLLCVFAQENKLHSKCDHFSYPSLFYNDSCFIATTRTFTTNVEEWNSLWQRCDHFPNSKKRLAFVRTPEQLNELISHRVVQPNISYFVGSRQIDTKTCGDSRVCCPNRDSFFYVDPVSKEQEKINVELFLRQMPDNKGEQSDLPERLVALEHANRFGGPANLVGNFPLLCEYKEKFQCPNGMVFAPDGNCIGVQRGPTTPSEALKRCDSLGSNGAKGSLPSIHDDQTNTFLANLARSLITKNQWDTKNENNAQEFEQYWPVLFGMSFEHGRWVNNDGSPTDYFRWWSLEEKKINLFADPTKGHKHVYLMVRTNGDDGVATFGYWANVFKESEAIPFFFCTVPRVETKAE
ncbi:hypothetical protein M3Y94_01159700 [Aphelenchoides besseyi]|nr:hypothetical protein M3Y94_01159700 [Aphelenchoides besseyi]KAI6228051.1 hypothetical protein M3Y95_00581600 [Aphelenchoides besseyi]